MVTMSSRRTGHGGPESADSRVVDPNDGLLAGGEDPRLHRRPSAEVPVRREPLRPENRCSRGHEALRHETESRYRERIHRNAAGHGD